MTATVPTATEFQALEARVAALEAGTVAPPEPEPQPPGEGVQAKRICQLVEIGINTFSSLDQSNLWGAWPSDYSPPSVLDAIRYCWPPESGFTPRIREYHYSGREQMQTEWLTQLRAEFPELQTTMCPGANAGVDDVPTLLGLYADTSLGIRWLEGINEPNLNFGSGTVPIEQTMEIQRALVAGCDIGALMGPSIVFGTPGPAGWIEGYCGEYLAELNASMSKASCHYYPPHCPDVPNTGYSLNEVTGSLWSVYGQHPVYYSEFHPSLYAAGTYAVKSHIAAHAGRLRIAPPPVPTFRAHMTRDPFYTALTMLRTAKQGCGPLWWFALFDYGTSMQCGLFQKRHAEAPTTTATMLRSLSLICADKSGTSRTFAPGKLEVAVDGLFPEMDWDVYQASDGRFIVAIWYAAEDPSRGPMVPVTMTFDAPKNVRIFDPLHGTAEIDHMDGVTAATVEMFSGVCILEVQEAAS